MSEPLDMQHPLWQLYLIDGLQGGRHAYLSKTHHALVDGVAAVDIGMILLDPKKTPTRIKAPKDPWQPVAPKSSRALRAGRRLRGAATVQGGRPRPSATTVRMPVEDDAERIAKTAEAFSGLAAGGPTCPKSPFNVEIGRDRRVAWAKADLDRLKRAREPVRGFDRQRRRPLDRRRARCAATSRAGARTRPSTWSRWSRSASAGPGRSTTWATGSRRSW